MTPNQGPRMRAAAVRDAVAAYQTAAWRAPAATRFDSRPANDFLARADAIAPRAQLDEPIDLEPMPRWMIIAIGGVIAAILGALLGGAMAF